MILDLRLERIEQIRSVISARRDEKREAEAIHTEALVRNIGAAVYASARNKRGMNQISRWNLWKKKPATPTVRQASRLFPVDESTGALFTPEDLINEQKRLGLI